MNKTILLTYVSRHGSTQEVAETIAGTLRDHGLKVDLLPLHDVHTLEKYSAVVLGAPLYIMHIHKKALNFLSRHRKVFANGMPVAIFAGGPFASATEEDWKEVRTHLDAELANLTWLKPLAVELVGGKFDPTRLRFPWNLLPSLRQMEPSDLRDWNAIRAWANHLALMLQPVLA